MLLNSSSSAVMNGHLSDGLNEHLNICYTYAHKWQYRYNASKCAVLVHTPIM